MLELTSTSNNNNQTFEEKKNQGTLSVLKPLF